MSLSPIDKLEHIIRYETPNELVPFLATLAKADVAAAREKLKSIKKELDTLVQVSTNGWGSKGTYEQFENLFLTGFAVHSRREALGGAINNSWLIGSQPNTKPIELKEHFLILITTLRPEWLHDWLLSQQTRASEWAVDYKLLRALEREQLIPFSPTLTARSLPNSLARWGWELSCGDTIPPNTAEIIATELSNDHLFLTRDLPLIFEFNTPIPDVWARIQPAMPLNQKSERQNGHYVYPWQVWNQKHPPQTVTWQQLFLHLTATHHLDRADILTRCLLALRRDFRRPLLTWFKELFLSLKPTRAERLARQDELTELLAHPLPLVVNFAIEQVKDLLPEPGFALAPLLQYADNLLLRPDLKTGLKTLLAGLAKLPRHDAAHAPAVARLLAAALAHPDATVQERAAKGLADLLAAKKPLLPPADTAETLVALANQAELLGSAARTVLAPWLAAPTPLSATEAAATYAPLAQFVPEISAATAITPVADWHELLFLTGQVLRHDDPAALERWLDGLLRLHGYLPAGYTEQLKPYLVQVLPFLQGKTGEQAKAILAGNSTHGHAGLAEALLLSWHAGFRQLRVAKVPLLSRHLASDPLVTLEQQRLSFAETLLHRGLALPLLSTPTHAPYYLVPSTLITRLLAYEHSRQEPDAADLVLALARTTHAHRAEAEEARRLLPQLRHEGLRELLSWLLSAEIHPLPLAVDSPKSLLRQFTARLAQLLPGAKALPSSVAEALPWLWAVAARTKYPTGDFPELSSLTPAECPGVRRPWQPKWELQAQFRSYVDKWKSGQPTITERWTELHLLPEAAPSALPNGLLLYSAHAMQLLPQQRYWQQLALAFEYPFLQALMPHYPAPLQWHALRVAAVRNEADATNRDILTQALHSLLLPGPTLEEPATLLLAVGLVHHAPTCRALAQEIVLATVMQQRLVPATLGSVLGQLLATGYAPVMRLADNLASLRAVSPATDDALGQLFDALLPALPPAPLRNLRKLLETYADLVARTRRPVPPAVQDRLRVWSQTAALKNLAGSLLK